jgi:DNA-binding beta-propeller fold protein YncE
MAMDSTRDILYVANNGAGTILVFQPASLATGNAAPARRFDGGWGAGGAPAIAVDPANDRVYIGETSGDIEVFDSASSLNGTSLPPTRSLTAAGNVTGHGYFALDTLNNRLYSTALINGTHNLVEYEGISGLASGPHAPDRTLEGFSSSQGLFVDPATDRLYLADSGFAKLFIFRASTASGTLGTGPGVPLAIMTTASGFAEVKDVLVDVTANDLYLADPTGLVRAYAGASTITGDVAPVRSLSIPGPLALTLDPLR